MSEERVPNFIAVTPVKPGMEAQFEEFVRDVIEPAVSQVRPHVRGTWRLLRPVEQPSEGAQAAYVFLFYGDTWDDYGLDSLFNEAYGEDAGIQRGREFSDFIAGEQIGYEFAGEMAMGQTQ